MKLIKPKVEIIPQGEGLSGVYKQIELAGRTCYKSENKITDDSAKDFTLKMISNGHTAMLEHGTVYLRTPSGITVDDLALDELYNNKYTVVYWGIRYNYVTTNLRVLGENNWLDLLKYQCEPDDNFERRVTARFTCDRGVSHELVRHRVFSFAQESTRYCNYSKDKFGNEITFIKPWWFDEDNSPTKEYVFCDALNCAASAYLTLIRNGYKPQDARAILPNALKTEVVMTGFVSDWQHFFDLRCAPNAHPDMQVLAKDLYRQFIETGLIK